MPKQWKYVKNTGRLAEYSVMLTSLTMYGVGMCTIMNPIVGVITLGLSASLAAISLNKKAVNDLVNLKYSDANQFLSRSPQHTDKVQKIENMISEISKKMDMATPKLYIVPDQQLRKEFASKLPLWRRIFTPDAVKGCLKKLPEYYYAAISTANCVQISEGALSNGLSDNEVKSVIAHELSHIKAKDSERLSTKAFGFTKLQNRIAVLGLIGTAFMGGGAMLPVALGFAALPFIGKSVELAFKYSSRIAERRADRNAAYLVDDAAALESMLRKIRPTYAQAPQKIPFSHALKTHPPFCKRIKSLRKSWKEISDFKVKTKAKTTKKLSRSTAP